MKFVLSFVLLASVLLTGSATSFSAKIAHDGKKSTFVAAAYEHSPIEALPSCYESVCDRKDALISVLENLDMYRKRAEEASKSRANIIVFPEYGFSPIFGINRSQLIPFSEDIPDITDEMRNWVPCDDDNVNETITAQQKLSCMAKDYGIEIVASMIDYKACDKCGEHFCLYDTAVMYDKHGKYVARYHKYNLFNTEFPLFNIDEKEQNVFIDTDYGRLGFIVCEDLLWYFPTVDLVKSNKIDTLIFATEWWDQYPHQLPHVLQQSWAKSLQINWIGANYHNATASNSGSGIFTTNGTMSYYHDVSMKSTGKLVLAELPVHPQKLDNEIQWSKYYENNGDYFPVGEQKFHSTIYGDVFKFVEMDHSKNEVKVCGSGSDALCCISKYDYDLNQNDGRFSLGIFEGIHYRDGSVRGSMGYQICTIMKCNATTSHLCDSYDQSFSGISNTMFRQLELSGGFNSATTVFPQSVFTNLLLKPDLEKVMDDGRLKLDLTHENSKKNAPLISLTLFGRKFGDDGPPPDHWCPHEDD